MIQRARMGFHALAGAYFRHERGRTLLTIAGVALGVAVLVAIDLAIGSAVASFKQTLNDVAGSATLTVRSDVGGLDPRLLPALARAPDVLAAAPLIQGEAGWTAADGSAETLILLGVDLLRAGELAQDVRDFEFTLESGRDLGSFLSDPAVIMLTADFARRAGAELGQEIQLSIEGQRKEFVVGALIDGGELAQAAGAELALLDIGIADLLLGRGGRLDRIDLITAPEMNRDQVIQQIRAMLPPATRVEPPDARGRQVDRMLAAFRFNLNALGLLSILVGAFLIYNTLSVAVLRRAEAIGTVRAMGLSRSFIRGVFLVEGALMGCVGGLIGILAGILLARGMLNIVTTAIAINFVRVEAEAVVLAPHTLAVALILGVVTSLAASAGPAARAAATAPANTMRRGAYAGRSGGPMGRTLLGFAAAGGAGMCLLPERSPGIPWPGYGASLLLIAAFVCWSRPLLGLTTIALRRPMARLAGAEGLLAVAGTRGALGRAGVAISGLMIALGMTIAVGTMVASFRETVVVWMSQAVRADLYLSAASSHGTMRPPTIPASVSARVEELPGVRAVDPFRMQTITINGLPAYLGAGRFDIVRYDASLRILDGRRAQDVLREARRMGGAIISEAFARKHDIWAGEALELPTPRGPLRLPVAGVFFDYSNEQGYAIIDRELYLRWFEDERLDSVAVYLDEDADIAQVESAIRAAAAATPGMPDFQLRSNRDLRSYALEAFNRTFRITWVLELIAIVIAVLGVANTLLSQIIDRREEIATLRTLGMTRRRVARVVVLESALVGATGITLGVGLGLALSWILARVIMLQSFGWTIQYDVPWSLVAQVAAVVYVSTLAAAVVPAREAVKSR